MPGVAGVFINIWLIINPESAVKPVTVPEVSVAVQWKLAPVGLELSGMFVDSPEQMDLESGLLVRVGGGLKLTITVSFPLQPLEFVTVTL